MRLCPPVSLCLAVAAALLPAPAQAVAGPSCAGTDGADFPLTTRLRGGPASYRAGGGYGIWYLDLTNTTRLTCDGIHPVVVLVDTGRTLKPSQARLEFYADGEPHPVRFEPTDQDELVGAFTEGPADAPTDGPTAEAEGQPDGQADGADGFPGFTVGPGRTLTVKLRLALTSDTAPNHVTANAAVVQRHGDDGDWIGQSNDYRFAVEAGSGTAPDADADADHGTAPGLDPAAPTPDPTHAPTSTSTTTAASSATPAPEASGADTGRLSLADEAEELARTGLTSPAVLVGATFCLLAAGTTLLLARRLARRRR
ncbi:hypothetical protein [Streptomyces sp. Root1310]|uniref:hypothetical protein n=1 Tax=Streptomyces sp. Root1310 TaxID=1736452 RepID=UPI00070B1FB9|nr:hypothetical protein [Streptomyces sp. Root1310]KQX83540.1 hypothetical protein ASD48_06130 [Streptomyces sp. Root1310]